LNIGDQTIGYTVFRMGTGIKFADVDKSIDKDGSFGYIVGLFLVVPG